MQFCSVATLCAAYCDRYSQPPEDGARTSVWLEQSLATRLEKVALNNIVQWMPKILPPTSSHDEYRRGEDASPTQVVRGYLLTSCHSLDWRRGRHHGRSVRPRRSRRPQPRPCYPC